MSKKEIVWHAYHAGSLCQFVDYEKRLARIKAIKPKNELSTRIRLMKRVVGQLPIDFIQACQALDKAKQACDEARVEVWQARDEVWHAYNEARQAYNEAKQIHKDEIETMHDKECPDCPWDGTTIFPTAKHCK